MQPAAGVTGVPVEPKRTDRALPSVAKRSGEHSRSLRRSCASAGLQAKTPGYFVLNLNTSYQVTPNIQLFGLVENVLGSKYYTFGTFSPTSSVFLAQAPGATNPRSYSPSAPVAGYGGLHVTF